MSKTKIVAAATTAALCGTVAQAAGIERTTQSVAPLFEEGRYLEFSLTAVDPDVSGYDGAPVPIFSPGVGSGDINPSYLSFGAAYKADLNETWSYAIILDQPFGADVSYDGSTGYFAAGSNAELNSTALTGILQYNMPNNMSVYGGVRYATLEANAEINFVSALGTLDYTVDAARDEGLGYLVGVAYEKPEIALRVALTYNSEIDFDLDTIETEATATGGFDAPSVTSVTTPDSLNLEFQTGIAPDTLLFGSVRWVDWSEFVLAPALWTNPAVVGTPLVDYADDTIAYNIGLGRRLNENWSVAASLGYETEMNAPTRNLGPTDGRASIGLGATYTRDNMKITAGVSYVDIGNAQTIVSGVTPVGIFEDNSAVAAGVKVGFSF